MFDHRNADAFLLRPSRRSAFPAPVPEPRRRHHRIQIALKGWKEHLSAIIDLQLGGGLAPLSSGELGDR